MELIHSYYLLISKINLLLISRISQAELWHNTVTQGEVGYGWFVIVIVNSKLLKRNSKASAGHQLIHERCVKSEGFSNSPWEAQVRLPEGERMRQIGRVFQRIDRG